MEKKFEPVLVYEDTALVDQQMAIVNKQLIPAVVKIGEVLKPQGIAINAEIAADAFGSREKIEQLIWAKAKDDVKSIKDGFAKQNVLEAVEPRVKHLIGTIRTITSSIDTSYLPYIGFNESGEPSLTKEGAELIRESARIYADTERAVVIHKKHMAAKKALQELQQAIGATRPYLLTDFFEMDFDAETVLARPVDYNRQ